MSHDIRAARLGACGNDDFVIPLQIIRRGGFAKVQRDLGLGNFSGKPIHQSMKFFFSRHLAGKVQLPAQHPLAFEQSDMMPTARCHQGRHHPCGPRPDNSNFFGNGGGIIAQFGFVTGARIDQATGQFARKCVIQTGLVTRNTRRNQRATPIIGLGHKIRICQKWPRHRNHIRPAIGQNLFGQFGRIDAV